MVGPALVSTGTAANEVGRRVVDLSAVRPEREVGPAVTGRPEGRHGSRATGAVVAGAGAVAGAGGRTADAVVLLGALVAVSVVVYLARGAVGRWLTGGGASARREEP